jgi:hypothetical protein
MLHARISWLTSNSACPKWGRDSTRHPWPPPMTRVTGHRQSPPLLWGWGCPVQKPGVTGGIWPSTTVVNLRITGQCHSPGKSVQLTTDPAPWWNNGLELGLSQALISVKLGRTKFSSWNLPYGGAPYLRPNGHMMIILGKGKWIQ